MKLSKEQLLGIVRHALTFVGGILIMNGFVSESVVSELSGAILTLVGGIWSVVNKSEQTAQETIEVPKETIPAPAAPLGGYTVGGYGTKRTPKKPIGA